MNLFLWEALFRLNNKPNFNNHKKIDKNIFFVHKETLCYLLVLFSISDFNHLNQRGKKGKKLYSGSLKFEWMEQIKI